MCGTYETLTLQIWRALRLIIDTGLHNRGMKRLVLLYMYDFSPFIFPPVTSHKIQGLVVQSWVCLTLG
jgi:hypothetical protein